MKKETFSNAFILTGDELIPRFKFKDFSLKRTNLLQ